MTDCLHQALIPSMNTMPTTSVIDIDAALDRYIQLTQIPGRSGDEKLVAEQIVKCLTGAGLDHSAIAFDDAHTKTDPAGNVGNLIVTLPGDDSQTRTMLSAHMDTVPICLGSQPERSGDEIVSANPETGLGADDRSGCAVILTAVLERLGKPGNHPPAVVSFLIQEEIGLRGAAIHRQDQARTRRSRVQL